MNVVVTGADQPFGCAIASHLGARHRVRGAESGCAGSKWEPADWQDPQAARSLVEGMDAVVHAAPFDATWDPTAEGEAAAIERATLGTYVLARAAREAGVGRIVAIGSLRIFDAYPANTLIDEMWKPRPRPEPSDLVPFLAEQCAREFAREGGICGICLRFLPIGGDRERNTRLDDALHAVDRALEMGFKVPGYRWHVFHVASSPRYLMRDAIRQLGFLPKEKR